MEFEKKSRNTMAKQNIDNEINLLEIFERYKYNWKWLILGGFVALLCAHIYLRYSHNEYLVTTTIFISDEEAGSLSSELSAFEDMGMLPKKSSSIINETGMLQSQSLMTQVIKNLGINITYFVRGDIITSEIYKDEIPFKINYFIDDAILYELNAEFRISVLSESKFTMWDGNGDFIENFDFGKNIKMDFGEINITPKSLEASKIGETILVKISPLNEVATKYNSRIKVESKIDRSSLLLLSLTDEVKAKAQDILNNLVEQYNNNAIAYKTIISENTDKFINDRINEISLDLSVVDRGVEDFKTKNKLTDIGLEASANLQANTDLQGRIIQLNSELRLVQYLLEYIQNNEKDLIPVNLGLQDQAMNQNTSMYNQLLLERNRIIKGSSELNPTVINLDAQLATIRQGINSSLLNLKSSINFSISDVKNREYRIDAKSAAAPKQEREYQDIKRRQQIIESLYLYLLEKREENAISLGIPIPNAKIIDLAEGSDYPVSPVPLLVYFLAGVMGLIVPIVIISVRSSLDNKVHNSDDVELVLRAPIIAEIPKTRSKSKVIVSKEANSGGAEAFRLLRTNVNFMLAGAKEGSKAIFVTSSVGGEGKTFITINLAASLALINKKVLLIEADIRKPKFPSYLDEKPAKGLTHFLTDKNLSTSDIIMHHEKLNIDVIYAGEIPPNPSELLLNGRFDDTLSYGRANYDYVIVDTSPITLVTDTLLLGYHADLFIYVIRAEFLDKRMLKVPHTIFENKRIPNMAILINATDYEGKGHGYGYGYGYGYQNKSDGKKSWWK